MPQVKVRGRGITADATAAVIREALGDGVTVTTEGDRGVRVHRNLFVRATVIIKEESGGTVFTVHGGGPPTGLGLLVMRPLNNAGIGKQVAAALEQHAGFSDEKV
jgi:hypothetical protein